MSTIEEAREQARKLDEPLRQAGNRAAYYRTGELELIEATRRTLRALLDATEPSDYHEGFEEGIKVGRAGSGPRPITDEMVAAADFAIMPYWGERYPSGSLTTEIARAALEAAEGARR